MITMLINTVGPIGGNLRRRARPAPRVASSPNTRRGRNANSTKPTPAPSSTSPRVTAKFSCVMVTMMYGSGMPMLYAFACFFCWAISYFDRRFLLRARVADRRDTGPRWRGWP